MKKDFFKRLQEILRNPTKEQSKVLQRIDALMGAGAALGLISLKLIEESSKRSFPYSEILRLFRDDKILSYHLDLGRNELVFRMKGSDRNHIASIPDNDMFMKDIHELVSKRNMDNPESAVVMDYSHGISDWEIVLIAVSALSLFLVQQYMALSAANMNQQMNMMKRDSKPNFAASNFASETDRKVTFDDVAGAEEEKEELKEVVEYLRDPERFTEMGARVPKGVLLVGPPGTGKTLLARAVAGEADIPFLSISGSEFVEMFVGVGAARVRDLFAQAKRKAPAIIFIDEIDALARKRASTLFTGNEERETTLNQLLVEMDGFTSDTGIIIIAATNRADILDPALLRPGRFDRIVHVGYPDIRGRKEILDVHSKGKPLSEDVDLEDLAKSTTGFTGADLENLLNEAALKAAKNRKTEITQEDLKEAAVKVMMGTEKKSKKMIEKERRITAFHEAGHAITIMNLENLDPVNEVSIIPRGAAGGYTMSAPQEDRNYLSRNEMTDELVSLLGGQVAEQLVFGDISTGASSDIKKATELARSMITKYGMSTKLGPVSYGDTPAVFGESLPHSDHTLSMIDEEINSLLSMAYRRAETILTENYDALEKTANYLLENEKISGEELKKLIKA